MNAFNYHGITPERFREQVPRSCTWVLQQERYILENGVALNAAQLADAKLAGVVHSELVRLLCVEEIPMPSPLLLRVVAQIMKLNTPMTPALAVRYGIFVRSDHWGQRGVVVRELAHIAQYERLGSVRAFLECYLYQCLAVGYLSAPMEQEAVGLARQICGSPPAVELGRPDTPVEQLRSGKSTVVRRGPRH